MVKRAHGADLDGSILLDSNVLLQLLPGLNRDLYYDICTKIKMATLTCRYFIVTEATLQELRGILKQYSKHFVRTPTSLKSISPSFPRQVVCTHRIAPFEGDYIINKSLDKLLESRILRVFNEREIIDSAKYALYKQKLETLLGNFPRKYAEKIAEHDARLIFTSKALSLPIFTLDQKIITVAGESISQLKVPFPFNSGEIAKIEVDELIELAEPFRNLYRKAFVRINEDISTVGNLRTSLQEKEKLIVKQHNILDELSAELRDTHLKSKQWQDLAKPKLSESITWTIVETLLGFTPFPIPTSPVTFFVQAHRYKKAENKFSERERAISKDWLDHSQDSH